MANLRHLIGEAHRRSLWQVLAIYIGAAVVGYQLIQALTEGIGLPDWVPGFAIVLFIIGLPIVLATAFVQEGGPTFSRRDPTLLPEAGSEPAPVVLERRAEGVGVRRLLTWRNAIVGGVLAFAFLGVVVTGYSVMRVMGIGPVGSLVAAGVIDEGEPIVLADFENHTSDSTLAIMVTEAFRIDLSQSPLVRLLEPEILGRALERMEADPDAALDFELARQVAIREGIKAVIAGEIGPAGGGFILSARLVSAETGEDLAAHREAANESADVLTAIDRLSKKLRERMGESLKTIRANEPLPDVTTGSLEALKKFSQAIRGGDFERGVGLYEEAIELDSTFAAAYYGLGYALRNLGEERARWTAALTKAYELRDRLAERERYHIDAVYHWLVIGERDKAITAYRSLLESYPDDWLGLNRLSNIYWELEDYERAEELYVRVIAHDSSYSLGYGNLLFAQVPLGKIEAAETTLARMAEKFPDDFYYHGSAVALASAQFDYERADEHTQAFGEIVGGGFAGRANTSRAFADLSSIRGKVAAAQRHMRDALAVDEERGLAGEYLEDAINLAWTTVMVKGDVDGGLRIAEEALERYPLDALAPLDRPYPLLASFYAVAGDPDRGRTYVQEYEATVDPNLRRRVDPWRRVALSEIALAEGRTQDAIEQARSAYDGACPPCERPALFNIAWAYDMAGRADSAVHYYGSYVEEQYLWRIISDAYYLPVVYERLGALHEARGDAGRAIQYYGKFADLWSEADPELQPRVEAARRAIAALSPDR